MDFVSDGVNWLQMGASINGSETQAFTAQAFYIGGDASGCWRIIASGSDLVFERNISGLWTNATTVASP
jgi:hypothetical protein